MMTDKNIHLEWGKDFFGSWVDCNNWCQSLGDGWRLPTPSELRWIPEKYVLTRGIYWSSAFDELQCYIDEVICIDFYKGENKIIFEHFQGCHYAVAVRKIRA